VMKHFMASRRAYKLVLESEAWLSSIRIKRIIAKKIYMFKLNQSVFLYFNVTLTFSDYSILYI
jgi:hypothetical protein